MDLSLTFFRGMVILSPPQEDGAIVLADAKIPSLAREIGRHLRTLVVPTTVTRPKGKMIGFSFHWSNAQAKWSVIRWNEPSWHTDGAEFLVYATRDALSPLGRPWSLKEMEYVAAALHPHPGYAFSMEGSARRVATKFLDRRV